MKSFLKVFLFAAVSLTACGTEEDKQLTFTPEDTPRVDLQSPMVGATDAMILGDIGPVTDISTDTDMIEVWDQDNYVSVEVVSQLQLEQAVMLRFSTQDRSILYPGSNHTFYFDVPDVDRTFLLLGCVGQEIDMWTVWDKPADEATIITIDGDEPNEVDVVITGNWYSTDTEATTAFTIQR